METLSGDSMDGQADGAAFCNIRTVLPWAIPSLAARDGSRAIRTEAGGIHMKTLNTIQKLCKIG